MRTINYIVLHCTATPQTATVASIQNYWKNTLGWKSPGYHHIIHPDGTTSDLQPIETPSNGVAGHNANSIHISYIGGVDAKNIPIDNRTDQQKAKQIELINKYKAMFPAAKVVGHRDFPGVHKACPSFDVTTWLKKVGIALLSIIVLLACNPAKKVMKNKEQFDQVGEAWSKEHPCVNDTVTQLIPGDTITKDGPTVTDTVYNESTNSNTITRTRIIYKTVHDTLVKNIRDTRAEGVLQNDLSRSRDSLHKTIIERNDYKAQRNSWRGYFIALLSTLLLLILGFIFIRRLH